jgi:hypothetical protein
LYSLFGGNGASADAESWSTKRLLRLLTSSISPHFFLTCHSPVPRLPCSPLPPPLPPTQGMSDKEVERELKLAGLKWGKLTDGQVRDGEILMRVAHSLFVHVLCFCELCF